MGQKVPGPTYRIQPPPYLTCIFLYKDRMVVIIQKNWVTETHILAYFELWNVLSFTCRTECFKNSFLPNCISELNKLDKLINYRLTIFLIKTLFWVSSEPVLLVHLQLMTQPNCCY